MSKKEKLEFFLLRYLPNVTRGEFVNFGAILVKDGEVCGVRFTHDWRRIQCLFPDTDIDNMQSMQAHLEAELRETAQWNEFSRVFTKYVSSGFELAIPKGVETVDIAVELETISKHYLDPLRVKSATKATGRHAILEVIRDEFEQAGVLKLMQQRVKVAAYTVPEDPFTIDYLYQVNDVVKMFQAVPVSGQGEGALALAYRCPRITAGLGERQKRLAMTAVVDAHDRNEQSVAFALHMLHEANIRVAAISEMRAIAETARVELRA